jgi:predicted DCC family thiol-disulfide oxidoreductase YuxK
VSKRWMPRSLDKVPDRLILFDGVCALCCWWVRFVIERDAGARFRFVAIQSTRGSRWRPVSPSMSPAPRLTSPLSMATHISNPTP